MTYFGCTTHVTATLCPYHAWYYWYKYMFFLDNHDILPSGIKLKWFTKSKHQQAWLSYGLFSHKTQSALTAKYSADSPTTVYNWQSETSLKTMCAFCLWIVKALSGRWPIRNPLTSVRFQWAVSQAPFACRNVAISLERRRRDTGIELGRAALSVAVTWRESPLPTTSSSPWTDTDVVSPLLLRFTVLDY